MTRCGKSENSTAEKINSHTVSAANKPKRLYRWSVCNKLIVCLQNRWLQRHCVSCVKGKYCDSISERRSIRFPHFGSTTHNARLVDGKFSKYTWMEIRDSMPFVLLLLSLVQSPWHSVLCYAMLCYIMLFYSVSVLCSDSNGIASHRIQHCDQKHSVCTDCTHCTHYYEKQLCEMSFTLHWPYPWNALHCGHLMLALVAENLPCALIALTISPPHAHFFKCSQCTHTDTRAHTHTAQMKCMHQTWIQRMHIWSEQQQQSTTY